MAGVPTVSARDGPLNSDRRKIAGLLRLVGNRNQQRSTDRPLLGNVAQPAKRRRPAHWRISRVSGRCSSTEPDARSALSGEIEIRVLAAIATSRTAAVSSSQDIGRSALKNFISGAPCFSHRHARNLCYSTILEELQTAAPNPTCRLLRRLRPGKSESSSSDPWPWASPAGEA